MNYNMDAINEHRAYIAELQAQLDAANERTERLSIELEQTRKAEVDARYYDAYQMNEIESMQAIIKKRDATIIAFQTRVTELRHDLNMVIDQRNAANARIAELEGNLSALHYDCNLYHEMTQQQLKGIHKLQTHIIERDARIAELEAAQAWVSVDERLPNDEDEGVIVWTNNGNDCKFYNYDNRIIPENKFYNYDIGFYHEKNGWLLSTEWEHGDPTVTHWMPLPPPPVASEA